MVIRITDGVIIGSCVSTSLVKGGGPATIAAGNNSVDVTHGLGVLPKFALATPINDAARQTGVKAIALTTTTVTFAYPTGVTQPDDGTFYWEVGT